MKVLRSLFVAMFIFTLFVIPASAQAKAGETYGFAPLLTQVDPASPLRVQAQQAFNRLLPTLLAAQKSGAILAFEPELNAGILKIKYAANARPAALGNMQVLNNIHAAVALVPHAKPADLQHKTAIAPAIHAYLYSSCFYAYSFGDSSRVIASLRNATGAIVANYAGTADTSGYLNDCFDWAGTYTDVLPGYKLTYKVYDTLGALLGTYLTIAPNISVSAINKATSVVKGAGPASKSYSIRWDHPNLDAANTWRNIQKTGAIPASGKWAVDFGAIPFRGDDSIWMYVTQNATFTFGYGLDAVSSAYCALGGNYCEIHGIPNQAASLTMTHAGVPHTFTGKFSNWGSFGATLETAAGAPIFLAAGDKISGAGIPVYKLPNLTAAPNYSTDVVSGKAPANKYFWVQVRDIYADNWYEQWTHSDAAGNYSADFSSQLDLMSGAPYTFEVYYQDSLTGNITDRYLPVGP